MESVIVGIFDNAQDVEQADKRLAAAGFEGTVYDKAIMADESCEVSPIAVGPLLAPGIVPTDDGGAVESDMPALRAFKSQLADYHLPDDVIEAYATAFSHEGKFVMVKTEPECAKYITPILQECHASRISQHDLSTPV